jgi:hypothetical protein
MRPKCLCFDEYGGQEFALRGISDGKKLRFHPLETADRGLYDAIRGTGIADSVRWVE